MIIPHILDEKIKAPHDILYIDNGGLIDKNITDSKKREVNLLIEPILCVNNDCENLEITEFYYVLHATN